MKLNTSLIAVSLAVFLAAAPVYAEQGLFIGLYGGVESHDVGHDIIEGDVDLRFDPNDDGDVLAINLGYEFNDNVFATLDFTNADADDTEVKNLTAAANYRFPIGSGAASFYLGVIGGYSELEWQEAPLVTSEARPESEKWFLGGQLGFDYRFGSNWSATAKYQYHGTEHGANITTPSGSSKITHDNYQYLLLGLRYHLP
jgi:hypothetical protein